MRIRKSLWVAGLLSLTLLFSAGPGTAGGDVSELERRIDVLANELDELKEGGLGGIGATPDRVSIHGYGEMHFNHRPNGGTTEIDNHRYVIGVHALLTDWIHLNVEIDFEHAAQELEFEFGYLDFLLTQQFNARAGVMLIPVGFLNEFHEPPLFWSVERPELFSKVIPTTWSAGGAGIFGTLFEGVNYRLYFVNSVQSVRPSGFSSGSGNGGGGNSGRFTASSGIRSGRLQANKAIAEDFALTGRLEVSKLPIPGLQLGFSFYTGDTTHDLLAVNGRTTVLEGDMKFRWNWFEMNSTVVNIDIEDAAALNDYAATQGTADGIIADQIFGWNIQAGVHVMQLLGVKTNQDLVPFILFEQFDTHESVPTGCTVATCTRDAGNDTEVFTGGLAYLPIPAVSLKMDYQHFTFANNKSRDQINFGVAYMF